MTKNFQVLARKTFAVGLAAFYGVWAVPEARGYAFNEIVPDVRRGVAVSGGSACPVRAHQLSATGVSGCDGVPRWEPIP